MTGEDENESTFVSTSMPCGRMSFETRFELVQRKISNIKASPDATISKFMASCINIFTSLSKSEYFTQLHGALFFF